MPVTFLGWVSFLLDKYGALFFQGTINTLIIAITGTVLGFIIGLLVAILRTIPVSSQESFSKKILLKIIRVLISIYIQVFRGTPMMVQAMIIYYLSLIHI